MPELKKGAPECRMLPLLCLLDREVTNFTQEEVVELIPLRSLRVERERILAFVDESGIVTPQVPVATLNGLGIFGLALTINGTFAAERKM